MSNTNHRLIDALKKKLCLLCYGYGHMWGFLGLHAHKYMTLWESNDIPAISLGEINYLHEFYRR